MDFGEVYSAKGGASFFEDLLAATGLTIRGANQPAALERLAEHAEQSAKRGELMARRAHRALSDLGIEARGEGGIHARALSNTAGQGGEFLVPAWMTERFASVARAAAPLKKLATAVDLPPRTLELHVPRFDTAAGVIPEEYENVNPPQTLNPGTDEIVSKVATFAGDVLVSQQLYDRGGAFSEAIILKDFGENYGEALQSQLMNGSGSNGQLLGLREVSTTPVNGVPGARVVTYTTNSPTVPELVKRIAECAGQISDTRKRSPSAIFMRGGRWFDIAGTADSDEEPHLRPGVGSVPTEPDVGPYGPLAQIPVFHDNTIPATLGAGANQDAIVLARCSDVILLEDPLGPRFTAYPTTNEAGELTVVLSWHHYVAALTSLYPSAIGTVAGTGLVYPGSEF